jgi:hypothetical protein
MKKLLALAILSLSLSASAAEVSRLSLVVYPDHGDGFYSTDVKFDGTKVTGQTSFGSNSMVSLTLKDGVYQGLAGGDGFTRIKCDAGTCSDSVGGRGANFTYVNTVLEGGERVLELKGSLNMLGFDAARSDKQIEVGGFGTLSLTKKSEGVYEGYGYLSRSGYSRARVVLKVSGEFARLDEAALFTVFVVRPFVH